MVKLVNLIPIPVFCFYREKIFKKHLFYILYPTTSKSKAYQIKVIYASLVMGYLGSQNSVLQVCVFLHMWLCLLEMLVSLFPVPMLSQILLYVTFFTVTVLIAYSLHLLGQYAKYFICLTSIFLKQSYEVGIVTSIFQIRKMKLRTVK